MIRTYGQMPEQLFHSAHQPHFPPKNVSKKVDEVIFKFNLGYFSFFYSFFNLSDLSL